MEFAARHGGDELTDVQNVKCYGNAKPSDLHLAADIVAVDGEVVAWLSRQRREQPQKHSDQGVDKQ
jgi:hypothetical protein